ncbi:MAG: hypothetical protein LBL80_05110 [Ruminococcus sp.]|nr:hypothetical protein [Ruminococcus sp.]
MKKETLIKKAAERGITLTESQAEKYVSISDEELENLDISGGRNICEDFGVSCEKYVMRYSGLERACRTCKNWHTHFDDNRGLYVGVCDEGII